jgi:O-antigen/teichoic acid export membrane protein
MTIAAGPGTARAGPDALAPAPASRRWSEGDTVVRGTVLAFLAKLTGGVFTAALTIFLARSLGAHSFGVLALALSIFALLELVSDFGVAVALPRFLAEERGDSERVRHLVADGLLLEMVGSVLFGGALLALAGVFADAYHAPALAMPLRALAIAMIGTKFLFFCLGVFTALRRQALNVWASLIESVAEACATVTFVVVAGGATAAAFGKAVGFAIGAFAGLLLAHRLLGGRIIPRLFSSHGNVRRILSYAANVWIVDGIFTAFMQIDSLLIGAIIAAGSVAFFQAPMRLILILQYPGAAIAATVAPRVANSKRQERDPAAFASSVRLLVVLMVPATVFTTVWSTTIIHYAFGPGYEQAAEVLRVLAPYVFLSGGGALVSVTVNYLGRARIRIPIAILTCSSMLSST